MQMALDMYRWTRADLQRMPDDGNRYEVVHGELLVSPAPSPGHDALVRVVRRRLEAYCDRNGIAHVSDHLPALVTPDSEVIPDIVVRAPAVPPPANWDKAPLPMLVVEVLSDSTRRIDGGRKAAFYMEVGVPEYWIVDGDTRSVRVVSADGDRIEHQVLRWQAPQATEAAEIDLPALFVEALGRS